MTEHVLFTLSMHCDAAAAAVTAVGSGYDSLAFIGDIDKTLAFRWN